MLDLYEKLKQSYNNAELIDLAIANIINDIDIRVDSLQLQLIRFV